MSFSELILNVLTFIMFIILAWFSFMTANIAVTIFRQKKRDKSMKFCFNRGGGIFFIIFTIIFVVGYIGGFIAMIISFNTDNLIMLRIAINLLALLTFLYSLAISNVILLGSKEMMIGRMLIDYRKMKKISYGLNGKVTFIYSQKEYTFTTQFTDLQEIRRTLKK
jgi:hypothetical protein